MNQVPMTPAGEKAMREELEKLKRIERPRIIQAIAEARAHGDLKENAEFHAAREEQGLCEARVREIEAKLSVARVIDVTTIPQTGKVVFGTTVTLINTETEEVLHYKIVGEDEADVSSGMISIGSPIARAIIGKQEDDSVTVNVPDGAVYYTIEQVDYK